MHSEEKRRFLRPAARHPLRLRRGVSLLPSLFTMGNMFCGYACIVYAMRGDFETAAPFIGIAVVLDMLDGRIARLTGTASDFGVELDSLADVISFGVAPAILVVCVGPSAARPSRVRGRVSLRQRSCASAGPVQHPECRGHRQALLRRDAESSRGRHRGVNGLRLPVRPARLPSRAACARDGACSGLLMVSTIRFRSFKTIDLKMRRPYTVLFLIALGIMAIATHPKIALIVIAYSYLASAFVGMAISRVRHHRVAQVPAPAEAQSETPPRRRRGDHEAKRL